VAAPQLAGEELQTDAGGAQLLGQGGQVEARPSRLCSCTTSVTATPAERSSRAKATALSSSGRVVARVEIFSAKTRVTPAAWSASSWVARD
jgi:hypothetical protein